MDHATFFEERPALTEVTVAGICYTVGDRVRLRPQPGKDVMDLLLAGRDGIIEAIEQDFEEQIYLAVVLDDDPGKELGLLRQPGHRFFYAPSEVLLLDKDS